MERVLPTSRAITAVRPAAGAALPVLGALCIGFAPTAYLGLAGGGFDALVHTQVGVAVWWLLLAGALVGAVPAAGLRRSGLAVVGAFALYAALSVASATWAVDPGRATTESAREVTLLGLLVLGAVGVAPGRLTTVVAGAYAGLVLVALVGLASRLEPALFGADVTGELLGATRDRLSRPLNYWNALGALVAMALPLGLGLATAARTACIRALALAPLPALVLVLGLTLSRGAVAAAAVALLVAFALSPRRGAWIWCTLIAGAGSALLLLAAGQRLAFRQGEITEAAERAGGQMLVVVLIVCASVAALGAAATLLAPVRRGDVRRRLPGWSWLVPAVVAAAGAIVLAGSVDWAARWDRFTDPATVANGADRLASGGGNGRWQLWTAAWDAFTSAPWHGLGAGGYAAWRAQQATAGGAALNAHDLYVETLATLGVPGLALLGLTLVGGLAVGVRAAVRREASGSTRSRTAAAGATAAVVALLASCVVDWSWQETVLPATALLLVGAMLPRREDPGAAGGRGAPRVVLALGALAAAAWLLVPLASAGALRSSTDAAASGDLATALARADDGAAVQPYAAAPLLQRGLVLEQRGDLDGAATALRGAASRAADDWRAPYVLARVEARRGDATAALAAYRRAKTLNPRSGALRP